MTKKGYFQHGDVLIKITDEIPADAKPVDGNVLQEGEHTGHAHRMQGNLQDYQIFETKSKQKFLRLVKTVSLLHEEHHEIKIPPGDYKIDIVKEYDPFEKEIRRVQD